MIGHNIRRNIFTGTASVSYQRPTADTAGVLQNNPAAQNGPIVYNTISGCFGTVTEYTIIADMRIMSQMHSLQQKITVPDNRTVGLCCSPVNNNLFPDRILISDLQQSILSFEFKILRCCTDNSPLVDRVTGTHTGTA